MTEIDARRPRSGAVAAPDSAAAALRREFVDAMAANSTFGISTVSSSGQFCWHRLIMVVTSVAILVVNLVAHVNGTKVPR